MSTQELISKPSFNIFPKPAKNLINLELGSEWKKEEALLSIYDSQGRKVLQRSLQNMGSLIGIDISKFPKGVLYLQVQQRSKRTVKRILKY